MKFSLTITERARQIVDRMTIDEQLDQLICPYFFVHNDVLESRTFGALFFHAAKATELTDAIRRFQKGYEIPPLIATDMENGPGEMITDGTQFPSLMGAGITDDEQLAYEMGACAAREGRFVGFNWSFSPCVDMAAVPDSPMVSLRAPGRDPDTIIRIGGAYLRGLQENGMIATLKHFPADGFDIFDQHLTVPQNPLCRNDWMDGPGRIYRELIHRGAMSIMPGHIALPFMEDTTDATMLPPPASLSRRVLTDLLRTDLEFEGLIVSDAVNMGGFAGVQNGFDAMVQFLNAGGDCILFPHPDYYLPEMKKRLKSGMLSESLVLEKAQRIIAFKDHAGLLDATSDPVVSPDRKYHQSVSRTLSERCVRVIRDRDNLLPLPIARSTRVAHVIISARFAEEEALYAEMETQLRKHSDQVTRLLADYPEWIYDQVYSGAFDLIVCSVSARHNYGTNVVRLSGPTARLMMTGWMRLGVPTVFVNHFHPFVAEEYLYSMDTVINTYGSTPDAIERVIKGITGEHPFRTP